MSFVPMTMKKPPRPDGAGGGRVEDEEKLGNLLLNGPPPWGCISHAPHDAEAPL